jgi:hypothetical protein
LINGFTEHIEDAAKRSSANRDGDWCAKVCGLCATCEAVGCCHGDGSNAVVAEMLLHLNNE